ncbi:MAG: cytidylyltransferase domain-containing protein, partial [Alphaproteobacteria bacterium]
MNIMIIIPARMASTRLPGKPLADIGGKPMIGHMIDIAQRSGLGPVLVAAGDQAIVDAVADVPVILTDPDLPSGSDRIEQALQASGATPEIV